MAELISNWIDHLLVATPNLIDTHFFKSVIYICEHARGDVLGVMINKPLGISVQCILDELDLSQDDAPDFSTPLKQQPTLDQPVMDQAVMMGGPVGTDQGFILYNDTSSQTPIHISSSQSLLGEIARGAGPENYLVSLGYAGWHASQLNEEIKRHDWLVVPLTDESRRQLIFDLPAKDRWHHATHLLGYDPHCMSSQVGHA